MQIVCSNVFVNWDFIFFLFNLVQVNMKMCTIHPFSSPLGKFRVTKVTLSKGGVHCVQVASVSQGYHTETDNHSHSWSYDVFMLAAWPLSCGGTCEFDVTSSATLHLICGSLADHQLILTCMSLYCGMVQEYLERTHAGTDRT